MSNLVRKPKHILLSLLLSLLIGLMTYTVAYAVFISIITDDGLLDGGWPVDPFPVVAVGGEDPGYNIQAFWVGTNADPPTEYYFRADLDAAMPAGGFLEARLDCNGDGDFVDAVDVLVDYQPDVDGTVVLDGTETNIDSQPDEYGEATDTDFVYEWKASTSGINVNWSACLANPVSIMLATMDSTLTPRDTTSAWGINVPTAVTFQRFDGVSTNRSFLAVTLVSLLFLAGLVVVSSIRPK